VTRVHVVMPAAVDDPSRPSGGNVYDRRLCDGLAGLGVTVHEHLVPGTWPWPDPGARRSLRAALASVPDGDAVVVDGLLASTSPDALVPEARRLRVVVLVHMPLCDALGIEDVRGTRARERMVLSNVHAVVVPSVHTRNRLLASYGLDPARVHVAAPGVDPAPPAACRGRRLIAVGAVTPAKGVDLLVDALAQVADRTWSCDVVGSLEVDPGYAAGIDQQVRDAGLGDRVHLVGAVGREALAARYARSDLLVSASRSETYGMALTEALARGIPVVATGVGGVREALGVASGGVPGIVVGAEDARGLAAALRTWLDDADLRARLRGAALERRCDLLGWDRTTEQVAALVADRAVEVAA
jgi:glycosyltransferase involved in cell wall biosynthesis